MVVGASAVVLDAAQATNNALAAAVAARRGRLIGAIPLVICAKHAVVLSRAVASFRKVAAMRGRLNGMVARAAACGHREIR
ncbi:MAG: hypothetical protein KGK15_19360 [Burkholderiales bacterium]|nr:hypothetical protein [Burkholderiales bacterium]MDE2290418.1 hypothetical protein [Burkholderiales bacterium]MDE2607985.1 hypothetical protein [Burkholderiales bacterium]